MRSSTPFAYIRLIVNYILFHLIDMTSTESFDGDSDGEGRKW